LAFDEPDAAGFDAAADVRQGDSLRWMSEELLPVSFVHTEEQLEVFAVGEGVVEALGGRELGIDVGMDRDGDGVEFDSDAAGFGDVKEIGSEAVAEVEHGVEVDELVEPLGLGDAGGESAVSLRLKAATELAGDEEPVARFRAGSGDGAAAGVRRGR
jgi:hypothetical protein